VYSRVRLAGLALAIRTVALGGPKAAPVGIAPAPLSFRAPHLQAGPNCSEQIGLQLRACSSPELWRMHCPLGVLDLEGANEREGLRRDAQTRLRPEIEGLRSD
jgi:hypothetical protein